MDKKVIITEIKIENKEALLAGLMEGDTLAEATVMRADSHERGQNPGSGGRPYSLGNIYVGKVQKIVKNINGAFIEIAPGVSGYYSLEKKVNPIYVKKMPSKDLVQGDELLVQVQKESVKTKAPTVTSNLTLTGRYAVLSTENPSIGVSGKLSREKRNHYKALLQDFPYGAIVRTNAQNVSDQELLSELNDLKSQMDRLIQYGKTRTCFSCVYSAAPKYLSYVKNSYGDQLTEIVTDQPSVFEELSAYCQKYEDLKSIPLRFYEDHMFSLANLYNLNRQLERAAQKNVWLKSGGFLVIEPTEALTVIDVNTGKSVSGKNAGKHYLDTNLEATEEIARQLRLRNISGIVIIDYIDMENKEDRDQLLEALKSAVKKDPVPVQVHDITRLHLVEVTRKKVEKTLLEQIRKL